MQKIPSKTIEMEVLVDDNFDLEVKDYIVSGASKDVDYRYISHKPKINGTTLIENYNEIDPTVPKWAKENTKPKYTAQEVNAVNVNDELSFTEIKQLWDSVFN